MRFHVGAAGFFVLLGVSPAVGRAQEPAGSANADAPETSPAEASGPAAPVPSSLRAVRGASGPQARSPGFETLGDGSTRLTLELSEPVTYDVKTAPNHLTYILKGAHVARRNDYNPLVTLHFNTPVASARLAPHGRNLWFAVELRASATPTVTTDTAKDGGIVLRIDFPKGDYLPAGSASDSAEASVPDDDTATTTAAAPGGNANPAPRPADHPRKSRSHH